MKLKLISIGVGVVCAVQGGPAEQAIMAAMRLSEQPNYSWSTSVMDDAGSYDLEGRTQKGGYTWMRFPTIKSIAMRLGRDADDEIEAVFNDAATAVVRTERGWKTIAELPRPRHDWGDDPMLSPTPASTVMPIGMAGPRTGRGGGFGAIDPLSAPTIVMPWPTQMLADAERRPYSNVQFAVSRPHDELAIIVSSGENLEVEGDAVTGTLSDVGARLLLVHEGQENQIQPLAAAGTFKLQVANGLVTKYIVRLEGVVLVDKKKILVHQTSSTTVKNVGTSAFDVTEEIRRKLSQ